MSFEDRIMTYEIDSEKKSCIRLGIDTLNIPVHMLSGAKKCGYIYKNGELTPWYWTSFKSFDGFKHIYFDYLDIKPLSKISTVYRKDSLKILTNLADALTKCPKEFMDLRLNILPLWRFYIIDTDTLLLLDPDTADIISIYLEEDEKFDMLTAYSKFNTQENFALIRQFAQLVYYALTNESPYHNVDVRNNKFLEIPLDYYKESLFKNLDDKTINFISYILRANDNNQREIMGNRRGQVNLLYFIEKANELAYEVENLSEEDYIKEKSNLGIKYETFKEKTEKKAKVNVFFRKKGTIIAIIVIATIAIGSIVGFYINKAFKPPITQGYSANEVINTYFEGINKLDISTVDETLEGISCPYEHTIISLFVSSRQVLAYENHSPHIHVQQYLDDKNAKIRKDSYIYGTSDVNIEQINENEYLVNYLFYAPYPIDAEDGQKGLYIYEINQIHTLEYNKRDWYSIVNIEEVDSKLKEFINIYE